MSGASHLTFDLAKPGVSRGHLVVPRGADCEALSLPVCCVNKGEGPRLLITGGCHGDELEGPIVARRLVEWLPEAQTCGRVIIVPVLNPLAVQACNRNTPVDGLNLNRVFPGRADGSVTERIADAVSRLLLPMADTVFDLHSFGPNVGFSTGERDTSHCRCRSDGQDDQNGRSIQITHDVGLGTFRYAWNV